MARVKANNIRTFESCYKSLHVLDDSLPGTTNPGRLYPYNPRHSGPRIEVKRLSLGLLSMKAPSPDGILLLCLIQCRTG